MKIPDFRAYHGDDFCTEHGRDHMVTAFFNPIPFCMKCLGMNVEKPTKRKPPLSYSLYFDCPPLPNPRTIRGGTYAAGGTRDPELNITYNYSAFFKKHLGDNGIRELYGKTAAEIVHLLDRVIPEMKGEPTKDYWDATEGNAKDALNNLRLLASLCPEDAKLQGD